MMYQTAEHLVVHLEPSQNSQDAQEGGMHIDDPNVEMTTERQVSPTVEELLAAFKHEQNDLPVSNAEHI